MTELWFTNAPDDEMIHRVGDDVEVLCDHENKEGERIHGWLRGVIVQADTKMVAIQFTENVYLTGGWMIPDHVLWCEQRAKKLRPYKAKRKRRPRTS